MYDSFNPVNSSIPAVCAKWMFLIRKEIYPRIKTVCGYCHKSAVWNDHFSYSRKYYTFIAFRYCWQFSPITRVWRKFITLFETFTYSCDSFMVDKMYWDCDSEHKLWMCDVCVFVRVEKFNRIKCGQITILVNQNHIKSISNYLLSMGRLICLDPLRT